MAPPLKGIRVIELAGLAPAPFCALLLSDFGATVLRIDRPDPLAHTPTAQPTRDQLTRNKRSITLNLKDPHSLAILLILLSSTDVLIDPFRPGVLESLGLAPSSLLEKNPKLIVARLSGFRKDGPYGKAAGHDINYLSVSGVLSMLGRSSQPPSFPGNLLADFAGGGLSCAFGILLALLARGKTGAGQVVESNMEDGVSYLATFMRLGMAVRMWDHPRGENYFDGGCPWYDVYECRGGRYVAVGAVEDRFFANLLVALDIQPSWLQNRHDRSTWPSLRSLFAQKFLNRTRDEWGEVFNSLEACVTPVLEMGELRKDGYEQRNLVNLSKTPGRHIKQSDGWESQGLAPGEGGEECLREWVGWQKGREYLAKGGVLVWSGERKREAKM